MDRASLNGWVCWRGDGVQLAVHAGHVHRPVLPERRACLQRRPGLARPLDMAIARDRRQSTFATHGVDRSIWAERRRGRLTARAHTDTPQDLWPDAFSQRL